MVETVTVTAKVQVYVGPKERQQVLETCSLYREACNEVSKYVFESGSTDTQAVIHALYHDLRSKYGLKSQMAQSAVRTVMSKYKSVESSGQKRRRVKFKAMTCDLVRGRDWSFSRGLLSMNTVKGRIRVSYESKGAGSYLLSSDYKYGTATVMLKGDGRVFLLIPVTIAVACPDKTSDVVGIDRGIRQIAVSYDGKQTRIYSGRKVKNRRAHFARLRKGLQQKKTPSARRRLKAIGHRENSWMHDVNHCVSKALVKSYPAGTLFVLEDLTGIRKVTERVKTKYRYISVSWPYADLGQKLSYKASLNGSRVITVDPRYTSQRCPVCGSVDKHSRDKSKHVYKCRHCGYQSNDDRIAAMNLYHLGLKSLSGPESQTKQSSSGKPDGEGCNQSSLGAKQRLSRR